MSNAKQLISMLNRLTNFSGRTHINIIKDATHNPVWCWKKKLYCILHVMSRCMSRVNFNVRADAKSL